MAQPDEAQAMMSPGDVEVLRAMTDVSLRAKGLVVEAGPAPRPAPPVPAAALTSDAIAHIGRARVLLSQQQVVGETRFRLVKRLVLRASRLFTHRLVGATSALADATENSLRVHAEAVDEVERLALTTAGRLATVEIANQDAVDALARRVLGGETLGPGDADSMESRLATFEARLHALETQATRRGPAVQRAEPGRGAPVPGTLAEPMWDAATYAAFEQRFRGSREVIRSRQMDALRFVASLAGTSRRVLDLGAGRGEWVSVLRDAQIDAYGVDLNASMVAEAVADGLDVRCEDAIAHLESLPAGSLGGVTAFHFAEHVPLPVLTGVLRAASRALDSGGLIVIETPNPTNLVVGGASFYLDPTHLRPLHPELLAFMVETSGFEAVEVQFVHPVHDPATLPDPATVSDDPFVQRLVAAGTWALFGAQDYVVVARKAGGST